MKKPRLWNSKASSIHVEMLEISKAVKFSIQKCESWRLTEVLDQITEFLSFN